MGAIIRALAVAPELRQLRRQPVTAPAASTAPANAPGTTPPASEQPAVAQAVQPRPVAEPDPQRARAVLETELAEVRRAAQQQLEKARADAEQRGYAAGEQRGGIAARVALQAEAERAASLAAALAAARTAMIADAEEAALELAFVAVCRILGEGAASRDTVLRLVQAGAQAMREQEQVCIRLHPLDLELLERGGPAPDTGVQYRADATIELGGCVIESGAGTLDARLETQLGRLRATLVAVRAGRRHEEVAA